MEDKIPIVLIGEKQDVNFSLSGERANSKSFAEEMRDFES